MSTAIWPYLMVDPNQTMRFPNAPVFDSKQHTQETIECIIQQNYVPRPLFKNIQQHLLDSTSTERWSVLKI